MNLALVLDSQEEVRDIYPLILETVRAPPSGEDAALLPAVECSAGTPPAGPTATSRSQHPQMKKKKATLNSKKLKQHYQKA